MGHIQRGDVDTFAADITPSAQRLPYFEFTVPWATTELLIVSTMNRNESWVENILHMTRPFATTRLSFCCFTNFEREKEGKLRSKSASRSAPCSRLFSGLPSHGQQYCWASHTFSPPDLFGTIVELRLLRHEHASSVCFLFWEHCLLCYSRHAWCDFV